MKNAILSLLPRSYYTKTFSLVMMTYSIGSKVFTSKHLNDAIRSKVDFLTCN